MVKNTEDLSFQDFLNRKQLKCESNVLFNFFFSKFEPIIYKGDYSQKSMRDWINRHTSIFLSEEESMGKSASADVEEEIESFTSENFDADIVKAAAHKHKDEL